MYILVTLNPDQGTDLGPNFTLTANVGSLSPATATLTQLLAGVTVRADDGVSSIVVTSQGICNNSITLVVLPPITTTTTTTTTAAPTTTTTTTAVPVLCFNYFVYADDGTGDKNSYSYSYITCAGETRSGARTNGGPGITICAQEGTVTSESGYIFADEGASCNPITTTTTAGPTVFCNCGGGCVEYAGTVCPQGCTYC
jgi:hypothetical protein